MLLSLVEITDFLSVRGAVKLDFDRKVTVLLGSNDHGKTNILKAVEHLNDDVPITEDEENWDATGTPAISFSFSLTPAEKKEWKGIVENVLARREELEVARSAEGAETEDSEGEENPPETVKPQRSTKSVVQVTVPRKPQTEGDDADVAPELVLSDAALDPMPIHIVLSRKGVGGNLQFDGIDLDQLPSEMEEFIRDKKPRVELFRALAGTLQDSATAVEIDTDEYEFLQGVFFYAGLDPGDSEHIFLQTDKTVRALDKASEELDSNLRGLWGQGTDLHFELRHNGKTSSIEFLADDPAIKSRKARMSKRSSGVTQFFRVSMVLYARRRKNPANSYIYLFDEPGVLLHPQGQKDLLQVFEQLADDNQIVYATHSLFLLNQNFPERHRLIYKDGEGTKVDQKPYRQNWKWATDALGVYFTSNVLFANRVLLVEGDSDPIYIYELFRQLNKSGDIDVDLNALGVMSFYDYQNLRFLLQVFKKEGQEASLLVLTDGDSEGKNFLQKVNALCKRLEVSSFRLPEGKSIEDFCLYEDLFLLATEKAIQNALEAEGKAVPKDLETRIQKSWEEQRPASEKTDKRPKGDKAEKDEKDERKTAGKWFKEVTREIMDDEASKVVLARTYAELCREVKTQAPNRDRIKAAKSLCQDITTKLKLPPLRAAKTIELPQVGTRT